MRERIGDRSLKKRFSGSVEGLIRREVVVEGLERGKETSFLLWPGDWRRVVPAFTSLYRAQGPVKEVAHVGEDLDGLAATAVEGGECIGRAIERAGCTIGKGCDGVSEKFAFVVHTGKLYRESYAVSLRNGEDLGHVLRDGKNRDLLEIVFKSSGAGNDENLAFCRFGIAKGMNGAAITLGHLPGKQLAPLGRKISRSLPSRTKKVSSSFLCE